MGGGFFVACLRPLSLMKAGVPLQDGGFGVGGCGKWLVSWE